MLNLDHPFFAQARRRHLTVAICVIWGLFELATGAVIWGAISFGIAAVAQWQFGKVDWSKYDGGH
ncbi:hypothetical protein GCM10007385_38520 [Tateyamaria omphalii]|uniref:hypothetical protein n=1 Tax=Tateyamaria omphalii TaxID=299262 RepID=UPI00167B6E2D|nr:hypothetical protein [Tateyamaria omphalii]GGX65666.1 hypothetical protein GCM10007385_38520 [Tateyamaria omphalii]